MSSPPATIVALATPPGRGGIAVVRLSGPDAWRIGAELIGTDEAFEARRAIVGRVRGGAGTGIDQAVVLPFAGPASYTGEDVVEFSLHGSMAVVSEVIRAAVGAGAVLAGPGEFTLRAFLNGRLDLAQAEAVRDLVDAATPLQARVAFDQLTGSLSGRIAAIEQELFSLSARLEASIDFPDEGYRFVQAGEGRAALERARGMIDQLLATAMRGRLIREGATVAIAGRPNVGKSSIFNKLVGADRAIVHEGPGTTRDLLTETVSLGGLRLTLADTAGVRDSDDLVEREGVARASRAHAAADLVLVVLDRSEPLTSEDRELLGRYGRERVIPSGCAAGAAAEAPADGVVVGAAGSSSRAVRADSSAGAGAERVSAGQAGPRCLVVVNKADLPAAWEAAAMEGHLLVSCEDGRGVDDLIVAITAALLPGDGSESPEAAVVSSARHVARLEEARSALGDAVGQLGKDPGTPEEVLLSDIQRAREALEEVTGKRAADALLQEIFSSFCVGK